MSRTSLCLLTAGILTALSLLTMFTRYQVMGDEVRVPRGPGTWKVTLTVQGTSEGHARLQTESPIELEHQHLLDEEFTSEQMSHRPVDARHPERRRVVWTQRPGVPNGPFRLRTDCHVYLASARSSMGRPMGPYSAAPRPGEYLEAEPLIECGHANISARARELTAELPDAGPLDVAQALFTFVEQHISKDLFDGSSSGAVACLERGSGDGVERSRLLVALLRNRNIPARVVHGVVLSHGPQQQAHYWVEAFVHEHWTPMCPTGRYFGRVPSTYVVFGFGDKPPVTVKHVADLKYAFLVERAGRDEASDLRESLAKRVFKTLSLTLLPSADRRLVEVLLLLPVAALIICVFRNVIGVNSFGTFAPALIGLAFHDLHSLPGILVFVSILLIGWVLRRALDQYHLLQTPRIATMLTLIMGLLVAVVVASNHYGIGTTRYISLFPMVILTGMIERFWTLETEDSTAASFKTLLHTMLIALGISLVLGYPPLVAHLFCYPETLGIVMACQIVIGRYTGYRLTELFRFRDFVEEPTTA
jgi:7 transmembrane helices usually fused to an inactive transglutaminase/Transglutaminase-like superfamily